MRFQKLVAALLSVLAEMLELLGKLVPIMKGNEYFVIESVWEFWMCHCLFINVCRSCFHHSCLATVSLDCIHRFCFINLMWWFIEGF